MIAGTQAKIARKLDLDPSDLKSPEAIKAAGHHRPLLELFIALDALEHLPGSKLVAKLVPHHSRDSWLLSTNAEWAEYDMGALNDLGGSSDWAVEHQIGDIVENALYNKLITPESLKSPEALPLRQLAKRSLGNTDRLDPYPLDTTLNAIARAELRNEAVAAGRQIKTFGDEWHPENGTIANVRAEVAKGFRDMNGVLHTDSADFPSALRLEQGMRILESLPGSKFKAELFLMRAPEWDSWGYSCNAHSGLTYGSLVAKDNSYWDRYGYVTSELVNWTELALKMGFISKEALASPEAAPLRSMVRDALQENTYLGKERQVIVQMVKAEMRREEIAKLPSRPIISTPEDGGFVLRGMLSKMAAVVGYHTNARQ